MTQSEEYVKYNIFIPKIHSCKGNPIHQGEYEFSDPLANQTHLSEIRQNWIISQTEMRCGTLPSSNKK